LLAPGFVCGERRCGGVLTRPTCVDTVLAPV
jgi:hypothetical protein